MTSQTVVSPSSELVTQSQPAFSQGAVATDTRTFHAVKVLYRSNHQAEYLDLNAEVESLLAQVQTLTRPSIDADV